MGKLFEVLAVEGDAQGRAAKMINEIKHTFGKDTLFKGKLRTLSLFDQDPAKEVETKALEAKDSMSTKVEATVPDSLNYLAGVLAEYWDVMYQKEATNQLAKADITIDGVVLLSGVPVTFLLCMENRLKDLRSVFEGIPTLAPGINWAADAGYGRYISSYPEISDVKTKEDMDYRIVAQATDKHPAQVVQTKTNFNIGKYTSKEWSGLISSAEKARLLENFDKVHMAVKTARQRANDVAAVTDKVSDKLLVALLGDWFNRDLMNPVKA